MNPSLHAQASAADTMATQAHQRGNLRMIHKDWEMLEPRLKAAARTLLLLNAARDRPGIAEFIAEIEGGA